MASLGVGVALDHFSYPCTLRTSTSVLVHQCTPKFLEKLQRTFRKESGARAHARRARSAEETNQAWRRTRDERSRQARGPRADPGPLGPAVGSQPGPLQMVVPRVPHLCHRRCACARTPALPLQARVPRPRSHVKRAPDSLVLGNALGFTVSTLGPQSQRSHRSFGIDLADAQVEEAAFSGAPTTTAGCCLMDALGSDEARGHPPLIPSPDAPQGCLRIWESSKDSRALS